MKSGSFHSKASGKPPPKFMSYPQALEEFRILTEAYRSLCSILLQGDAVSSQTRAELLALRAALDGRSSDGEGS